MRQHSDVPKLLLLGEGHCEQLTNNCYFKKMVAENTITNSLAPWLPFDQFSCKFENIVGGRDASYDPNRHISATVKARVVVSSSYFVFKLSY